MMTSRRSQTSLVSLVLFLALMIGCGPSGPTTYEAKGTVLLDDAPIAFAIVTLIPVGEGRSCSGVTDLDGKFTLSTFAPDDGALAGDYQVTVIPRDPPPMPGSGDFSPGGGSGDSATDFTIIPDKYGYPKESGISATVSADGENVFEFKLTSDGQ